MSTYHRFDCSFNKYVILFSYLIDTHSSKQIKVSKGKTSLQIQPPLRARTTCQTAHAARAQRGGCTYRLTQNKMFMLPLTWKPEQNYLHKINKILHKMGLVPSPMCSFCGNTEESLEHLFIYCDSSRHFWSSVTDWLNEFGFDARYLSTFDIGFWSH